jgi:hypothetical protein
MRILIPHPPGPLLLQEKGVEKNLGVPPNSPKNGGYKGLKESFL